MQITKEWLFTKRQDYERQLTQAVALVNNIHGAIQGIDFLLQDIDLPEVTLEEIEREVNSNEES